MAEAFVADICWDAGEVEISGPVADGMRAAEREDCTLEAMVDGYVASHAC